MRPHTGEKPYQCSECDFFLEKSNLDQHIMIHSGEKPYGCTHCEKAFSNKKDLDCHMCTHIGDKSYQCGATCLWQYALNKNVFSGASRMGALKYTFMTL